MSETSVQSLSLRDRKKAKLRHTILEVANRLFLTQGYERTTLEQVCEEAETSLRTLLRYFPTKEDLALGREVAALEHYKTLFEELDHSTPVIQFWRNRVHATSRNTNTDLLLQQMKLWDAVPALAAKTLALQVGYEDLLAAAFAREAGVNPADDLYGRLLAGMLIAGNRAAGRKWLASDGKLDLAKLRSAVVDWAVANFPSREDVAPPKARAGQKR